MKRLLIIGAGGHGRSVAEAAVASGKFSVVGFLDDAYPKLVQVWDIPVLGTVHEYDRWREMADCVLVAIGNNALRQRLTAELRAVGFELATIIHPRAIVSPTALIATGSALGYGVEVGAGRVLLPGTALPLL